MPAPVSLLAVLTSLKASGCGPSIKHYTSPKTRTTRFYVASQVHDSNGAVHVLFQCLPNYHLAEGTLDMKCLPNNTLSGTEPRCEVDFFMEKQRLSLTIALISFLIPVSLLFMDFCRFVRYRHALRSVSFRPIRPKVRVRGIKSSLRKTEVQRNVIYTLRQDRADSYEDIFQNKTVALKITTSKTDTTQGNFQMLGAARAFGHIGKIITRDLF